MGFNLSKLIRLDQSQFFEVLNSSTLWTVNFNRKGSPMLNKYHTVTAWIDGEQETLFGSYIKADCIDEIEAERHTWKEQGYKRISVTTKEIIEGPDPDLYKGEIVTKAELWLAQAPSFNFEKGEDELLELALERGFVSRIGDDAFLINKEYEGVE